MATEKQLAANRRNAAKSTGPRTQDGKARSRMNALRHGLAAVMLSGHRRSAYDLGGAPFVRILQIDDARTAILSEITGLLEQGDVMALEEEMKKLAATERYMTRAYISLKKSTESKARDGARCDNSQNEPNFK